MDGIPSKIGRYRVERLLGTGAMGFVYLGVDPHLDRQVAIKTVRDTGLEPEARARFLDRFRNEAKAAGRLHHPNIVQVFDFGEDEEAGPYLVFEYVEGTTLKQRLRAHGALPPAEACRLADQVGSALAAAHAAGVIHRDVKPDNLLVTSDGRVKLADFGVARVPRDEAALTRDGQFLGTPCYAAPETLQRGQYGPHSDVFSFALVLYEVVSGSRAFPGTDAVAVAHKVIHDEPPPPSMVAGGMRVPHGVDRVIMDALVKDPDAREQTPQSLAAAMRRAYEAAEMVAPETGSTQTPSVHDGPRVSAASAKPASGGSAWLAVGLTALFALGLALVVVARPSADESDAAVDVLDVGEDDDDDTSGRALVPPPVRRDAAIVVVVVDAGAAAVVDAGPVGPPPLPDVSGMSPHAREEAAKDALGRARRAADRRAFDEALAAIREARHYDPGNPDVDEIESRVRQALAGNL